jgi:hypothetical protein
MEKLLALLRELEKTGIHNTLFRSRDEGIMVTVNVPGQMWEVEFLQDGEILLKNSK